MHSLTDDGMKKEGRRRVNDTGVHTIRCNTETWTRFATLCEDLGMKQGPVLDCLLRIGDDHLRQSIRNIGKETNTQPMGTRMNPKDKVSRGHGWARKDKDAPPINVSDVPWLKDDDA